MINTSPPLSRPLGVEQSGAARFVLLSPLAPSEAGTGGHGGCAFTLEYEKSDRKAQALELSTLQAL